MVLEGRRFCVALAVLAAVVGLLTLVGADPAPAQQSGNEPQWGAGAGTLQRSDLRAAQNEDSADPLIGLTIEPTATSDDTGEVTRAVIRGISCDEIADDAFLTVEDANGLRGRITNNDGVQINAADDQIVLTGEGSEPIPAESTSGERLQGALEILNSEGFDCTATDDGDNGNGDNVSGDDNDNGNDNGNDVEVTVIKENTVIRETIPNDNLPDTGGTGADASMAGLLAGAGVFVLLGALVVRIFRFRNS